MFVCVCKTCVIVIESIHQDLGHLAPPPGGPHTPLSLVVASSQCEYYENIIIIIA